MSIAIQMTVNGKAVSADIDPRTLLVQFLRDNLSLTGTHVGCDTAQCGACIVLVDGKSVKACNLLAVQVQGAVVTTIEGLAKANGELHPMQAAFRDNHGLQCGFCTPGMVISAVELAGKYANPTDEQIRAELEGNLCRCTGYQNIVASVKAGLKAMQA